MIVKPWLEYETCHIGLASSRAGCMDLSLSSAPIFRRVDKHGASTLKAFEVDVLHLLPPQPDPRQPIN